MIRGLFYKEWIKTRWFYLLLSVLSLSFMSYVVFNIMRIIHLKGAAHIWEVILMRDQILVQMLRFIPLVVALVSSLVQFVPEMQQKRLKLQLHLPMAPRNSMLILLVYGLLFNVLICGVELVILGGVLQHYFAYEIVSRILLTLVPWMLEGLILYILIAWICVEPTWKRRIFNALVTLAIIRIFHLSMAPEAYSMLLPYMIGMSVVFLLFPIYSMYRFTLGKQD